MSDASSIYVGKDLESMSFAVNYHRWILEEFRPFLGPDIVEVGAGTGNFSEMLLGENPETLCVVEPSDMFEELQRRLSANKGSSRLTCLRGTFSALRSSICESRAPSSIVYVNVLEHIREDQRELESVYRTLPSEGVCLIFVPALMCLYGRFDRQIGHWRRYGKRELETKCTATGFRILKSKYFDMLGVVPWWIKFRLLQSSSLNPGATALYDRLAVPVSMAIERRLSVPVGKNILLVAQKP